MSRPLCLRTACAVVLLALSVGACSRHVVDDGDAAAPSSTLASRTVAELPRAVAGERAETTAPSVTTAPATTASPTKAPPDARPEPTTSAPPATTVPATAPPTTSAPPPPSAAPAAAPMPAPTTAVPTTAAPPPTTTTAPPAPPAEAPAPPANPGAAVIAADLVGRINATRAAAGAPPLARDGSLDSLAAGWSAEMSASGDFRHSAIINGLVGNGWSTAGENIAYGHGVTSIHDSLVASPGHYDNIVGAGYSSVGVGVVVDPDGRIWVTELFAG